MISKDEGSFAPDVNGQISLELIGRKIPMEDQNLAWGQMSE